MPDKATMIEACYKMKRIEDQLLGRAFVTDIGEARIAAALCLKINEQFAATVNLVENKFSSHAPIMLRSMLEACATLKNLNGDPQYLNILWLEKFSDDIAIIDACLADVIAHDLDAQEVNEFQIQRSEAQLELNRLKSKGVRKEQKSERFKAAGMLHEYTSYRVLCGDSHNQILSLVRRHVGNSELLYGADQDDVRIENTLGMAVGIVSKALEMLPNFTDLERSEVMEAINAMDKHHWFHLATA
jgi:hypothetical protein